MLGHTMRKLYWWMEPKIAPGVRYAQSTFEDALFDTVSEGCTWLDLGCGHTLLPEWRAAAERKLTQRPAALVGLDPEHGALRDHRAIKLLVCGNGMSLPFRDGVFDLVTANMVVEHLADPLAQFREVARVLKPGGRFLFHTPNATGYPTLLARSVPDRIRGLGARLFERRAERDRFPTFYRANTPAQIEELAGQSGFPQSRVELIRSDAMFAAFPPFAVAELLFLRVLGWSRLGWLRPNLIALLTKAR